MTRTNEDWPSADDTSHGNPAASLFDRDCEFCRRLGPSPELKDRVVYEDQFLLAALQLKDEGPTYRGTRFLQTKRHVGDLASLTDEEAVALGRAIARLSRALKTGTGAAWE